MRLRERIPDPNIWRIYAATFALGLAYGIAIALLSLFLDDRGFSKQSIGTLAAWFAGGIVAFSLPMGPLVERLTAKRTLALSFAGYALTVSAFPLLDSYAALAAIRFADGAFSVGIWVSAETMLLARSDRHNKALVTSLYAIFMAVGYVAGPLCASWLVTQSSFKVAFFTAGGIATAAAVYVALFVEPEPSRANEHTTELEQDASPLGVANPGEASPALGTATLLYRIKTSCFATFSYGYFQASVVLFLPLYLIEQKGILESQAIALPAYFAAGMLLFSSYAGRLGDRVGHLLVMRLLAVVGTLMILGFVYLDAYVLMCSAVFIAGASLASISPLSLALQGVVTPPADYSRSTSIYNAFYAAGMLLGPPASSWLFVHVGGPAMLYHLAALWAGFVVFSVAFYRDDPASLHKGPRSVSRAQA